MSKNEMLINKRQGQQIESACRECRRSTKHEIVTEATLSGSSGSRDFEVCWAVEHQVIRCMGCDTFSFRRVSSNDQDVYQTSEDEWIYNEQEDIYPNPHEGRVPLADDDLLPPKVQRIYGETLTSLNNRQNVLCGIGIRAIVETVCKDKQSKGKDLNSKINSLVSQGVLTKDGADILHKLRTLGNNAAHEAQPHTPDELRLAFDVLDHLLLGVYILPIHAKKTFR
jgi:Domain of unknown function (DUF4145)